jgi:hypothetical protein
MVSAEMGAVAPLSDTLHMSGGSGMAPSSRDRISVDLHGLKAGLFEQARAHGVSPSRLVRDALAEALGQSDSSDLHRLAKTTAKPTEGRVRLSLRISREEALVILAAARYVGLPPGAFIAGLAAGVPALTNGARHNDHLAALIASSAELSTLSRNICRLTALLRQANVEPARQYREMLDALAGHVRSHLKLAASVLADLRPRGRRAEPLKHPTS